MVVDNSLRQCRLHSESKRSECDCLLTPVLVLRGLKKAQNDPKSKKWWHRLFWGIMDIVFVNSFVINNELNNSKLSVKQFRRSVAQGLIVLNKSGQKRNFDVSPSTQKNSLQPRRGKQLYSIPSDVRLGNLGSHWIEYSKTRGRCEVCCKKKIESKPFSKCSTCKVFLCQNEKNHVSMNTLQNN